MWFYCSVKQKCTPRLKWKYGLKFISLYFVFVFCMIESYYGITKINCILYSNRCSHFSLYWECKETYPKKNRCVYWLHIGINMRYAHMCSGGVAYWQRRLINECDVIHSQSHIGARVRPLSSRKPQKYFCKSNSCCTTELVFKYIYIHQWGSCSNNRAS